MPLWGSTIAASSSKRRRPSNKQNVVMDARIRLGRRRRGPAARVAAMPAAGIIGVGINLDNTMV